MYVAYLSADASDEAITQFKENGTVQDTENDWVEMYTLEGFEIAFNDDERISDLGYVKFMNDSEINKSYDSGY